MKALVLGCDGQLGQSLARSIPSDVEFVGLDMPDIDITDADMVSEILNGVRPTIILNAAAYTAVDQAESDVDRARAINKDGPRNIANIAAEIGARVIHVSTDFVFDGTSTTPYAPSHAPNPLSVYGLTKFQGEQEVLKALPNSSIIVRTAWLYSEFGNNFVKTMLQLMSEGDELKVVADQMGTPTWAGSLARTMWLMASQSDLAGIFHWTDGGKASWYEFAQAIQEEAVSLSLLNEAIPICGISTSEYPTAAKRPQYSVLNCTATCAALNHKQTHWRENLRLMLKRIAI
jgi:dTDP-4-dehydrorhamnose reductase